MESSWDFEFEGEAYERNRFCCNFNFCNGEGDGGRGVNDIYIYREREQSERGQHRRLYYPRRAIHAHRNMKTHVRISVRIHE